MNPHCWVFVLGGAKLAVLQAVGRVCSTQALQFKGRLLVLGSGTCDGARL